MTAVAAITRRIELGFLVLCNSYRPPALLAKMAAAFDDISQGRLILGYGAGWFVQEYEAYGYEYPSMRTRLEQLEEGLEILKRMWTEEAPSFAGKHFKIDSVICEPKPVRRPPILVGGGGEKVLLRIAAEHADIWNNLAVNQGKLVQKRDVLRRHCDAVGRDFAEIALSQQTIVVIGADESEGHAMMPAARQRTYTE